MKNLRWTLGLLLMLGISSLPAATPDPYSLVWDSPSLDSSGSMPLGNGDIALNAWMEPSGDLVFYIAKSDAVSENSQFLKLGRIRVQFTPALVTAKAFRQELSLKEGALKISVGEGDQKLDLRLWVDAHHPVIHCESTSARPVKMKAKVELWRLQPRPLPKEETHSIRELGGSPEPVVIDPDLILPSAQNRCSWVHRNERSTYPLVMKNQHLDALMAKYPDPLLYRTFGCVMEAEQGKTLDPQTLQTPAATRHHLAIYALTAQTKDVAEWQTQLLTKIEKIKQVPLESAWTQHTQWWQDFFQRSWIRLSGGRDSEGVTRAYTLHRWMVACAGRGALPQKFNGSLFTVDTTVNERRSGRQFKVDADYRMWGSNYWFQNMRLIYWPLITSGDDDLLEPFFRMYREALPLAVDRTKSYYKHEGAFFSETMYFWGTGNNNDFGWANPDIEPTNPYIKRYWTCGLELIAMMLDRYEVTSDAQFVRETLLPVAEAVTVFFDQHWPRDAKGKIRFDPSQSLETWHVAVNPLPEIAGLRFVLPRLLELPSELVSEKLRAQWKKTLKDLPELPAITEKGGRRLLPAETYSVKKNAENAELYAVFPFRLFGVGRPDLATGLRTHAARFELDRSCWSQEGIHAALLGLADQARANVVTNFVWAVDRTQRFPAFWRPGWDWVPDLDNGGAASIALQEMLMQCVGEKIYLLPAWPKDWNADFKLRAPGNTTIQAKVQEGKVIELLVTPESRRRDVILP